MDTFKLADMATGPLQPHECNQLLPCPCFECSRLADGISGGLRDSVNTWQKPHPVRAGALIGALQITACETVNAGKSKEELREIFLTLAAETFDLFGASTIDAAERIRARLAAQAGKQH